MSLVKIKNSLLRYLCDVVDQIQASAFLPIIFRRYLLKALVIRAGVGLYVSPGVSFRDFRISFGDLCVVGRNVYFDCGGGIEIGRRVHLAANVQVLSVTHSIMSSVYRRDRQDVQYKTTRIEDGCWLGTGCIILAGVTIGQGCVIGAGSVVIKDCLPNGLYVGNPAVRKRDLPVDGVKS